MGSLVLVGLFVAGIVEYMLAAGWTQALVAGQAARTGAITFINVLVWGFVVTNLQLGDAVAIVTHGLGCALGAAGTVWWRCRSREDGDLPAEDALEG